jgi:DNA mismatch repair protein MutS2
MYLKNSSIPTLDLHGTTRDIARVLINDFVYDNYIIGNKKVSIIHGIGTGIIKNEVRNTLKISKYVESFKINNFNIGETIVIIKDK